MEDDYDLFAALIDDQQHGDGPKLSDPDPFMLAAYCFDLKRKQNYLYMALRMKGRIPLTPPDEGDPAVPATPQELVEEVERDTRAVEYAARGQEVPSHGDWVRRAYALEEIIRRQHRQIHPDHENILRVLGERPTV